VEKDCQAHKLNKVDAIHGSRWRKVINDEQDGYRLCNHSSSTLQKCRQEGPVMTCILVSRMPVAIAMIS